LFLDTANIYSYGRPNCVGGESEGIVGRWMKDRKNRRDLFIATKVGMEYPGCEKGLSKEQITTECEKSLKRLGIETIDLYYAHADDRLTPLEESLSAFDQLRTSGKVRFIGASNHQTWRLAEALATSRRNGWTEYCCLQQRYCYLRPKPGASFLPQVAVTEELLEMSTATGLPIIGFAPLLKGAIAGRSDKPIRPQYDWADSHARMAVLKEISEEVGATQAQVALAWMTSGSAHVIPLLAAGTVDQLRENLGAFALELDPEQVARLNEAGA
jgi:aryl-alcohol dehydrogenase-like predicted oxidoreductase